MFCGTIQIYCKVLQDNRELLMDSIYHFEVSNSPMPRGEKILNSWYKILRKEDSIGLELLSLEEESIACSIKSTVQMQNHKEIFSLTPNELIFLHSTV